MYYLKMLISVVGLGKLGLPLSVQFASKGFSVTGLDVNPETVRLVNLGIEPFPGEEGLSDKLAEVINEGNFSATLDAQLALVRADVIVVVVPLLIDKDFKPDFSLIDDATEKIGKYMKKGALVVFETTLPVGTTRKRFLPILEKASGFTGGSDFFLSFSPERVLTGRVFSDLSKYPKLVGGINKKSACVASEFYSSVIDFAERAELKKKNGVWNLGSCETAEMVKLAETTYRDVNIALANQFAIFARNEDINIDDVIEAANSQSYSKIHNPGISVGGHCIPVYPHLYLSNDPNATLVSASRLQNSRMPFLAIQQICESLGDVTSLKCVIFGISYRSGVKESAFSGSLDLLNLLTELGVSVFGHDLLYTNEELSRLGFIPYELGDPIDFAIVQNDSSIYQDLNQKVIPGCKLIYDGRRVLDRNLFPEMIFLSV